MDILIQNGTIVTEDKIFQADIGIRGEKIASIRNKIPQSAFTTVIDAKGNYIFPGGIDAHVHFQLPIGNGLVSKDTFSSGTKAAACGGITTIIDFATQQKGESLISAIQKRKAEAESQVCIDYSLHCAITDWNEKTKKELGILVKQGIPSFKFFLVYGDRGWKATDAVLFSALEESARLHALVMIHAENDEIVNLLTARYSAPKLRKKYGAYALALSRPNYVEEEAVVRTIKWAEVTGGNLYIVHMSTSEAAAAVRLAQLKGIYVYAETCLQYLLLTHTVFRQKNGHLFGTCPPVKSFLDKDALWQALANGTIAVVATDTCSFDTKQKSQWHGDFRRIPYGMPGVETMMPLLFSEGVLKNRIALTQFVQLTSTNPAKLFGLYPQKGNIRVGADADLVIFDPNKRSTISAKSLNTDCDWSPYEGKKIIGAPIYTLSRGRIIVQNSQFIGQPGHGHFIKRKEVKL
ncbi:MAG: dihydropyrimidinase [bacterium]